MAEAGGSGIGRGVLTAVLAVVRAIAMLLVELVAAMLVYLYLNLFHPELFGYLVRVASDIFGSLTGLIVPLFQDLANQAYASLIGELSPKAVLLLFIGLVVGALIRFVAWGVGRLIGLGRRA